VSFFGLWFGNSHLGFGTHMPTLAAAVLRAGPGPVVEYGMGFYSSPLLHLLCEETRRPLLSLESDRGWGEKFAGLSRPQDGEDGGHRIVCVDSWQESEAIVDALGAIAVAFIDHGPNERRVVDAKRLAHRAEFVVVHDWEDPPEIDQLFACKWVSRCAPRTAVLSNRRVFGGLK